MIGQWGSRFDVKLFVAGWVAQHGQLARVVVAPLTARHLQQTALPEASRVPQKPLKHIMCSIALDGQSLVHHLG